MWRHRGVCLIISCQSSPRSPLDLSPLDGIILLNGGIVCDFVPEMIHLKNLPCNPESCAVFGVRWPDETELGWVEIYSFNLGFVCYTQIDPPDGGKYTHTGAGVTSVNKQIKRVILFWNNISKINFIVENCKIWLIEMLTCCLLLWGMKGWKIKNQEIKLKLFDNRLYVYYTVCWPSLH